MKNWITQLLHPTEQDIQEAARILRRGGLVAFPTETVYGLGADACSSDACESIYKAKGRPSFNPLIVHVLSMDEALTLCQMSDDARALADAFWPGPLTLVLPLSEGSNLSPVVSAGLPTVAMRVPAQPLARDLLRAFGGPIAAPSANLSGRISPTTAAHVIDGLDGKIDAVINGGACKVGLESTIISATEHVTILREGGVTAEAIENTTGQSVRYDTTPTATPSAAGQLASHYAPKGRVRLNVNSPRETELMLGFGAVRGVISLSETGDLAEAAARLFECLHQLDAMGATDIAVAPIPETGLGRAINDRLRRAAAPREPN